MWLFLRPRVCAVQSRDSTGRDIATPVTPAIVLLGPCCIQVGLDIHVGGDVSEKLQTLTSITTPTPPCTGSFYHNTSLMKIHVVESTSEESQRAHFLFVGVCSCSKNLHVCPELQKDGRSINNGLYTCTHSLVCVSFSSSFLCCICI